MQGMGPKIKPTSRLVQVPVWPSSTSFHQALTPCIGGAGSPHPAAPTISLKALSRAPMTKHSCGIFFSVKKRVGGVLGEPGVPTPPRKDAARVRVRLCAPVCSGSSPRQVGGSKAEFLRISTMSCSCSETWCCSRRAATTAAPEPAWPSNSDQ